MVKFWIRVRHNLQLGVYYVAMGQMTEKDAMKYERNCLYGDNYMRPFATEAEYKNRLDGLKKEGQRVQ